eukprot:g2757.t1
MSHEEYLVPTVISRKFLFQFLKLKNGRKPPECGQNLMQNPLNLKILRKRTTTLFGENATAKINLAAFLAENNNDPDAAIQALLEDASTGKEETPNATAKSDLEKGIEESRSGDKTDPALEKAIEESQREHEIMREMREEEQRQLSLLLKVSADDKATSYETQQKYDSFYSNGTDNDLERAILESKREQEALLKMQKEEERQLSILLKFSKEKNVGRLEVPVLGKELECALLASQDSVKPPPPISELNSDQDCAPSEIQNSVKPPPPVSAMENELERAQRERDEFKLIQEEKKQKSSLVLHSSNNAINIETGNDLQLEKDSSVLPLSTIISEEPKEETSVEENDVMLLQTVFEEADEEVVRLSLRVSQGNFQEASKILIRLCLSEYGDLDDNAFLGGKVVFSKTENRNIKKSENEIRKKEKKDIPSEIGRPKSLEREEEETARTSSLKSNLMSGEEMREIELALKLSQNDFYSKQLQSDYNDIENADAIRLVVDMPKVLERSVDLDKNRFNKNKKIENFEVEDITSKTSSVVPVADWNFLRNLFPDSPKSILESAYFDAGANTSKAVSELLIHSGLLIEDTNIEKKKSKKSKSSKKSFRDRSSNLQIFGPESDPRFPLPCAWKSAFHSYEQTSKLHEKFMVERLELMFPTAEKDVIEAAVTACNSAEELSSAKSPMAEAEVALLSAGFIRDDQAVKRFRGNFSKLRNNFENFSSKDRSECLEKAAVLREQAKFEFRKSIMEYTQASTVSADGRSRGKLSSARVAMLHHRESAKRARQKMIRLEEAASKFVFRAHNRGLSIEEIFGIDLGCSTSVPSARIIMQRGAKKSFISIDFHLLYEKEAMRILSKCLRYGKYCGVKHLEIITGAGHHSPDQKAKLRPAILHELKRQEEAGRVKRVHLSEHGGSIVVTL